MKYCFGIDVGGTTIKIGLFEESGNLLEKWEIPTRTQENGKDILDDIANFVNREIADKGIAREDVLGVGIGVPGPVTEEGCVLRCVNLGWGIFNVKEELQSILNLPVEVGNDANVAALGEAFMGGGKGFQNVVMVTLGTGVGGGIIVNGEIITGARGAAGELGHITVNYDETKACNCGKCGCVEQYASATGIVNETKKLLASCEEPSSLRTLDNLSAKSIFDEAKAGDVLANRSVHQLCRYLGIALAQTAQVVDPEVFVIGGGVSKAGEILTKGISEYYNRYVMKALKEKEFRLAVLGNDAGIYGSAKLVLGR